MTWKFNNTLGNCLTPDGFGRFDSKVRIPFSGSILLSPEVRAVIDTAEFQHLRGVRQLGPTMFVFPGANHTRFEHSLGVYALTLRYLERLSGVQAFRAYLAERPDSIKLLILAALLHDIGHYPYSHWIEELETMSFGVHIADHEQRAESIINKGTLRAVVESVWNVRVADLIGVITGAGDNVLVNSILHSAIDSDKIDYLLRDSIHCGVEYGKVIDLERLLDALTVDPATSRLCLSDKGASTLLSILACRNIMYMEVYWHKTVRACEAMFKRFFYEYLKHQHNHGGEEADVQSLFRASDDEYIAALYRWAQQPETRWLRDLVQPFAFGGRETMYKPAMIFAHHQSVAGSPGTAAFFARVFSSDYSGLVALSNLLAAEIAAIMPGVGPADILIEKTPIKEGRERSKLAGLRIYNERGNNYEPYPPELDSLNTYLINHKRIFIFCHPRLYPGMKELAANGTLDSILSRLGE